MKIFNSLVSAVLNKATAIAPPPTVQSSPVGGRGWPDDLPIELRQNVAPKPEQKWPYPGFLSVAAGPETFAVVVEKAGGEKKLLPAEDRKAIAAAVPKYDSLETTLRDLTGSAVQTGYRENILAKVQQIQDGALPPTAESLGVNTELRSMQEAASQKRQFVYDAMIEVKRPMIPILERVTQRFLKAADDLRLELEAEEKARCKSFGVPWEPSPVLRALATLPSHFRTRMLSLTLAGGGPGTAFKVFGIKL